MSPVVLENNTWCVLCEYLVHCLLLCILHAEILIPSNRFRLLDVDACGGANAFANVVLFLDVPSALLPLLPWKRTEQAATAIKASNKPLWQPILLYYLFMVDRPSLFDDSPLLRHHRKKNRMLFACMVEKILDLDASLMIAGSHFWVRGERNNDKAALLDSTLALHRPCNLWTVATVLSSSLLVARRTHNVGRISPALSRHRLCVFVRQHIDGWSFTNVTGRLHIISTQCKWDKIRTHEFRCIGIIGI